VEGHVGDEEVFVGGAGQAELDVSLAAHECAVSDGSAAEFGRLLLGRVDLEDHIPALKDAPAQQKALDDTRGGRLGVVDAAKLVFGVVDIDAARRRWQPLLAPAVSDAAMGWTLGRGPALRLVHHERNEVLDLALGVASPSAANDLASLRAHDDPLAGLPLSCIRR
jgi:hypothetical protein